MRSCIGVLEKRGSCNIQEPTAMKARITPGIHSFPSRAITAPQDKQIIFVTRKGTEMKYNDLARWSISDGAASFPHMTWTRIGE